MSKLSSALRSLRKRAASLPDKSANDRHLTDGGPQRAHFVRDYRRFVRQLIADYPIDQAMSIAVGGNYAEVGKQLAAKMAGFGLRDGMQLLDLGCGSGRLAHAIAHRMNIDYLGLDVVPELLDYARTKCPPHYRFHVNEELSLPAPSAAFDMVSVFSVFTHLLHEESYLYLCDIERVLRPGGVAVITFLEFGAPEHWALFEMTIHQARTNSRPHLNVFVERNTMEIWARRAGLEIAGFDPPMSSESIGQTIVLLSKPEKTAHGESRVA